MSTHPQEPLVPADPRAGRVLADEMLFAWLNGKNRIESGSAAAALLTPAGEFTPTLATLLRDLGFEDLPGAWQHFQSLCETEAQRALCYQFFPALLYAFLEAATPDGSLLNFLRFIQSVPDRDQLFATLAHRPRTVEILVKLFVGSQYLTEILLRNPHYLNQLAEQKRLAEFKSREEFIRQCRQQTATVQDVAEPQRPPVLWESRENGQRESPRSWLEQAGDAEIMNHLRQFQQWELLRLAACDKFGLMDLKTVTLQLSLLADALVQVSLEFLAAREQISLTGFTVLAMGKLGGEELNYSSDIDLVFVSETAAEHYWGLGQKLIQMLDSATEFGFLYRVDLRLRPWGAAGALVVTADAYVDYMQKSGQPWEKQALLKSRPIAGNREFGSRVLKRLEPFVFNVPRQAVKQNIRCMKEKIEQQLERRGKSWGDVKSGRGGIRDIEFLTQYLQLIHGSDFPHVRCCNTLESLIRLSECELIFPEEYRRLSGGYLFLRTVEHALQLMHNHQSHRLPIAQRSLAYLARRLDYPDADTFLQQYEQYSTAIREVFEKYLLFENHPAWAAATPVTVPITGPVTSSPIIGNAHRDSQQASFDLQPLLQMRDELNSQQVVRVQAELLADQSQQITMAGFDRVGALSTICGLLFASGFDITSGRILAGISQAGDSISELREGLQEPSDTAEAWRHRPLFLNEFHVRRATSLLDHQTGTSTSTQTDAESHAKFWERFQSELNDLCLTAEKTGMRFMQSQVVQQVAMAMERPVSSPPQLLPVEIEVDLPTDLDAGTLHIRSDDAPGFLYELTNAIAVSGLSIRQMTIQTVGQRAIDTLHVVDEQHHSLQNGERLNELRAAIVLIKHFIHLLPGSPHPELALRHFQEFLENLFQQPNWLEQLSQLQDSKVLSALATLLGNSNFLWDDFLRLQHENLFPVVTNVEGLQQPKSREMLDLELISLLKAEPDFSSRLTALNAFKDRQMMRVDMRHILRLQENFGDFGRELTEVAESVVSAACELSAAELAASYGFPRSTDGTPAHFSVCALGKFGGRELGYASDIELMFLYDHDGQTDGPESLSNADDFHRLVRQFQQTITSRRRGIFELDLRLRPYGNAGTLAVSLESFTNYFGPHGTAWPYERQALVKLRPIAGDERLGARIVQLRDQLIYRGEHFDVGAMRAMREKQNRQLVRPGTFNAKLSPGGLVDCEYLVQGLQITFGHLDPALREPNTREALRALGQFGILSEKIQNQLQTAYQFWRQVIDALRVVRGNATDLTIPPVPSEEFAFLARRMRNSEEPSPSQQDLQQNLQQNLERQTRNVIDISANLPLLMQQTMRFQN